ncbi:hypothetical protein, partial [Anaeromicrobium sediminis]
MLSNEKDILKEIKAAILEPEPELKQIAELLKRSCRRKKRNYTTGPVIKPVRFDNNSLKQQPTPNFVIVKALNNTSRPQTATVYFYDLAPFIPGKKETKTKDNCLVQEQKVLFFSQTIQVQPQSTVFLPVDITAVTEYEVQVLDAPVGMYFSTEFLPATPIPTAQPGSTSPTQNQPGAVIDSH